MKTIDDFLMTLFHDLNNEYIEVRLISPEGRVKSNFYESIESLLRDFNSFSKGKQYNCYFGICPRKEKSGGKNAVSRVQALWADLDAKQFEGGKDEAFKKLQDFAVEPTLVIDSGNGYHAYWKLKESGTNWQEAESYLKGIALTLGADASSSEIARIFRLPETVNLKNVMQPLPVEMIYCNPDNQYKISDFDEFLNPSSLAQKVCIPEIVKGKDADNEEGYFVEGNRNDSLFRFACKLRNVGLSADEILASLIKMNEERCRPPLKESELKTIAKSASKYLKSAEDIKKNKVLADPVYSASFPELVDLVDDGGKIKFLVSDSKEIKVVDSWETEDAVMIPPPQEYIKGIKGFLLPRATEVLRYISDTNDKKLYEDLLQHHKNISELPIVELYDVITAWDFHTYLLEKAEYSPYIYFFSEPERGKSRTGKGMVYVAYRGVHSPTINEANLIRLANDLKATLFVDAKDLWAMAEKKNCEDVLLARYERGLTVSRVLYPDKGKFQDTVFFEVFGPTAIGTNVGVHDILETRAIEINMPETDKDFENIVTPETCLPLKERLVAFRARNMSKDLPSVPKPAKSRLGDILKPLLQILRVVNPEREPHFIRAISWIENLRKIDRSMSPEANLLWIVMSLEPQVECGILTVRKITKALNDGLVARYHKKEGSVGKQLTGMGFERGRDSTGLAAIVYDNKKIDQLCHKYGVKKPSDSSDLSDIDGSEGTEGSN